MLSLRCFLRAKIIDLTLLYHSWYLMTLMNFLGNRVKGVPPKIWEAVYHQCNRYAVCWAVSLFVVAVASHGSSFVSSAANRPLAQWRWRPGIATCNRARTETGGDSETGGAQSDDSRNSTEVIYSHSGQRLWLLIWQDTAGRDWREEKLHNSEIMSGF